MSEAAIIGKVAIKITPDTSNFRRDAERQLSAVERQLRIVVDVVPNVLRDAAANVRRQLDELGNDVTTNIRPDLDDLSRREAEAALARLAQSRTATIRPDVEKSALGRVKSMLTGLLGMLSSLATGAVKLTVLSAGLLSAGHGIAVLTSGLSQFAPLALALPGLLAGAAIGVGTLAVALKDLPKEVPQVKTAMANIKAAITDNFWDKAKRPISSFVDSIAPVLTKGFGKVSTALGGFVGTLASSLKSSGPAFAGLFADVAKSIKTFTGSAPALANIFTILTTAGASILPRLTAGVSGLVDRFSTFLTKASASGKLSGWFNDALNAARGLGQAIGSVFSILGSLGKALSAGGGLGGFQSTLSAVAKAVASPAFQGALAEAVKFSGLLTSSLLTLAGALAKALGPVISSLLSTLGPALASLAKGLGPVLASLGSALTGLIDQLGPGLSALSAGIVGALAPIAKALGPTLKALGPGLNAVFTSVGKVLPQLGQALATLLPALAPIANTLLLIAAKALPVFAPVIAQLAGPLANLAGQFNRLLTALSPLIGLLVSAATGFGTMAPTVSFLVNALASVVGWIATAVSSLGNLGSALGAIGAIFSTSVATLASIASAGWSAVRSAFLTGVSAVASVLSGAIGTLGGIASSVMSAVLSAFSAGWSLVRGIFSTSVAAIRAVVTGAIGALTSAASSIMSGIRGAFSSGWSTAKGIFSGGINAAKAIVSAAAGALGGAAHAAMTTLNSAFRSGWSTVRGIFSSGIHNAISVLSGIDLSGIGSSIIHSLIGGITSAFGAVKSALGSLTSLIPSWKGPPSTDKVLLYGNGQLIMDGLIRGIKSKQPTLLGLLHDLTQDIPKKMGKTDKLLASSGAALIKGLIDGIAKHEPSIKTALDKIADNLNVFKGKTKAALKGDAVDFSATLKSYDDLQVKIKSALDALNAVKKQAADKAASIRDALISGLNITSFQDADGNQIVDFSGVKAAMTKALADMQKFAKDLALLKKLGLNSTELDQLAEAGPDAGLGIADAILAQGQAGIDQLNKLQAKLTTATTSIGNTVASSMYAAGIASAQGLLNGLKAQEPAIIAEAKAIAKKIAETIKKALDIHSPSRVMMAIGVHIGDGLRIGLESSYKGVHESISDFAKTVSNADYGSPTLALKAIREDAAARGSFGGSTGNGSQSNRTFNYYAAPGRSSSEEDVFTASQRSRFAF